MRERDIEHALVKRITERGGEVRKVGWIGRAHAPDRLILLPNQHYFVELKAPGVKPSDGQLREHRRMRNSGCSVIVIDSLEAIEDYFPSDVTPQEEYDAHT